MQPDEYAKRLQINREKVKRWRHSIYHDPIKHAIYKKKQREAYKKRVAVKAKNIDWVPSVAVLVLFDLFG